MTRHVEEIIECSRRFLAGQHDAGIPLGLHPWEMQALADLVIALGLVEAGPARVAAGQRCVDAILAEAA